MPALSRTSLRLLTVSGICVLALSGCTASETFAATENYSGKPKDITLPAHIDQSQPYARWAADGKSFTVTFIGSMDCTPTVTSMAISPSAKGIGQLAFADEKSGQCTDEGVPHTTVLPAPDYWQENDSDWALEIPASETKIILSHGDGN